MAFWNGLTDRPKVMRNPASLDCNEAVIAIANSALEREKNNHHLFKVKNSIWNKILSNREFDNFNESEYFRWMEIYKDASGDMAKQNPITIEQKMALIEVINEKTMIALKGQNSPLTDEIEKLSALKLRKLAKHLESLDLSSKQSREFIEEFSADLFVILKGPPISLTDYFTRDKSKQMTKRLFRTVQEDILSMGLKGMIDRIPEKNSYTKLENAEHLIQKFILSKRWKYFVMPYDLPWFERLSVPDELLQKILRDGLDAHNAELIEHLKSQGKIDHYERFRKVYRPIAFSVGFMFYYTKFNSALDEDLKNNQEEEKQNLLKSFEDLATQIEVKSKQTVTDEQTLKNEQYERLLSNYREQYGENPSAEEIKELKDKIFQ